MYFGGILVLRCPQMGVRIPRAFYRDPGDHHEHYEPSLIPLYLWGYGIPIGGGNMHLMARIWHTGYLRRPPPQGMSLRASWATERPTGSIPISSESHYDHYEHPGEHI